MPVLWGSSEEMQKLMSDLKEHANLAVIDDAESANQLPLVATAKEWAAHSLDTYSGELLRKAMAVSVAVREFADEFDRPSPRG